jgi:hypothetical protein
MIFVRNFENIQKMQIFKIKFVPVLDILALTNKRALKGIFSRQLNTVDKYLTQGIPTEGERSLPLTS